MEDEMELPSYLGGHLEKTHIDGGVLRFMKNAYGVTSMLDIGCSTGGMVRLAQELEMKAEGIEGDWTLENYWDRLTIHCHDFHDGPCEGLQDEYDLAWCVEFLEHVDEAYIANYMVAFERCRFAICTVAPPGAVNAHHFNLKEPLYWQKLFADYGFVYDEHVTQKIRRVSAMTKPFMQKTGMFFKRENVK